MSSVSDDNSVIPVLNVEFSYDLNGRNEPFISALLKKLRSFVTDDIQGYFYQQQKDVKSERYVKLTVQLPNKLQLQAVTDMLNDIQSLVDDDETAVKETETEENMNLEEDNTESNDEDDSADETWSPPALPTKDDSAVSNSRKRSGHNSDVEIEHVPSKKSKTVVKKSTENNTSEKRCGRRRIPCPLLSCKASVVHLPRHMCNVHHWTKEAASKVLSKFNKRKQKDKSEKRKDYHSRRRCPIKDCHSVVQRLSAHLQKVHKLEISSDVYVDALQSAVVAPDHQHSTIPWKEDQVLRQESGEKQEARSSTLQEDVDSEHDETDSDSEDESDADEVISSEGDYSGPSRVEFPSLFVEFEEWLRSPDGGKRDEKTVKQHGSQLFAILKAIDNEEEVTSLLDVKLIRVAFLKKYVKDKNYGAATIKSYLMSLRHFYSFLLSDQPEGIVFDADEVRATREKVQMWSVSYKRESNTRKWQKLEEDTMNQLTPANIRSFEKSSSSRDAVKILGKHADFTETTIVTQQSYTLVRDFLCTQLFIANANRPGVLAEMTMAEYKKMSFQDGHYVILVMKHKTAHVHGPARIVLNTTLKSWLTIFVDIMCSQITSAANGKVFLSWNGKEMTSGHITKAVQSVFKKSGVCVKKLTSTSFRKAAVTKVHAEKPELSGKLARHMAHNESTARKYYLLAEKSKESVEASKKLGQLMRHDGDQTSQISKDDASVQNLAVPESSGTAPEANKKVPWDENDLAMVKKVFEDLLSTKSVSIDQVRDRIDAHSQLHGMSPRRVYDKLRKEIMKNSSPEPPPDLPDVNETLQEKVSRLTDENETDDNQSLSIIAPTERTNTFTTDDVSILQTLFRDMIIGNVKIGHVEVKERCDSSQEGKKLLKKLSVAQIINRVKYERRKTRSQC